MNKLKYKFITFMQGRYGIDELYNVLLIVYAVVLIINCFTRSTLISLLLLVILAYTFFRVFSKNIAARQKENAKFLLIKRNISDKISKIKKRFSDKEHVYRKCPYCKAQLRFPKRKGVHQAFCPRCKKELKIRIYF